MPRRDQEALLLQNSIAEEESSMGTQIPLAKSTSVTLFQHHHQGEGENNNNFLTKFGGAGQSGFSRQRSPNRGRERRRFGKTTSHVLDARLHRHPKRSWYKSKILVGNDMCQSCYKKERLVLSNRICNDCQHA